jgi:hypothetical protein
VRAAAKASVPWILPTEFGTDAPPNLVKAFALLADEHRMRRLAEQLGISGWVGAITNPWYEYYFAVGGDWGIDIPKRRATLWDGGDRKVNTSTRKRAGEATAELLALPEG